MKPTEKQIKFLKECIKVIESYIVTNDIDSRTHLSDIYDRVNQLDAEFDLKGDHLYLDSAFCDILQITRQIENGSGEPGN